jgi:uncharacterized protein YbjT (DUF2867 family)
MSIAITGAAGQLGRLVIDDLLSAGIPGTDLIASLGRGLKLDIWMRRIAVDIA